MKPLQIFSVTYTNPRALQGNLPGEAFNSTTLSFIVVAQTLKQAQDAAEHELFQRVGYRNYELTSAALIPHAPGVEVLLAPEVKGATFRIAPLTEEKPS